MSGTPTPRTGVLPWVALAALWGGVGLAWLAWLALRMAAGVGGGQVAGFGDFLGHLLSGHLSAAYPGVPWGWIAVFGVLMGAVAIALGIGVGLAVRRWQSRARRRQTWRLALPSMAHPADVAPLAPAGVAARARALRPSLAGVDRRALLADAAGWVVGDLLPRGPVLRGSWEDVAVAFMAPRSGKTTALAIPMTLAAPGAVVATGNKADLWAATAALCTQAGRGVWTFDPQQIAHAEQTWWWNPLAAISGIEDADRLAGHFLQEVRGERGSGDFWMAAAGYPAVAAGLRGRQSGAPETREGVYETARAAARCLRNDRILRWVTPGHVDRQLDVTIFTSGRDALYLMSKTDEGAASPLVAALTDQVVRAGVRRAEAHGGRLDPPLLLVLDEAANICKIADLPDLYSHLGSRGIVPMTILQSYRQGVRVWGEPGMDALWSAATIKIIGAGIDDPRLAEDLSKLVGEHDVPTESISHSTQGVSVSISARRQRILDPADIRALPKGRALLLATGTRVAAIALRPWYTGPHRTQIGAAITAATAHITDRAAPPPAARDPSPAASDPQAATSLE